MKRKEFVVIGMGQFGSNVAKTLASSGAMVMIIDKNEQALEMVADHVTHAICADATNAEAMRQLGIKNYDGAIIGIGHDLESNVLITIQLKEMGVPFIMTKAATDLEGRILCKVGADKVIFPDKEMGIRVGNHMMNGNYFEAIELSEKYSIVDIGVPASWVGHSLRSLNIRHKYGVSIIGIRMKDKISVNPEPDYELQTDDILIVLGHNSELQKLHEIK